MTDKEELDKDYIAKRLSKAIKYYRKHGNLDKFDRTKIKILVRSAGYNNFAGMLHDRKLKNGEETYNIGKEAAKKLYKALGQFEKYGETDYDGDDLDLWAGLADYEDFGNLYRQYKRFGVKIRYNCGQD